MKSSQQDNIVRTSCKNCVLAVYKNKTQVGCIANRIEKLQHFEAYDEDKEFFVIERLCNYYRDDKEKYIINNEPYLEKIKLESQISFDIIIDCNDIDEEYKKRIISFYTSTISKYNEDKIKIQLISNSINKDEKNHIFDMRRYIGNPNISFVLDSKLLHDKIIETRNSYHFVISKINFPKIDFIYDANNLINEDMEKAIVITDKNVQAISNLAYKIEFSQKNTKDYNEIVNSIITSSREMNLCHIIS